MMGHEKQEPDGTFLDPPERELKARKRTRNTERSIPIF